MSRSGWRRAAVVCRSCRTLGVMRSHYVLAAVMLVLVTSVSAQVGMQPSHIEGKVPPSEAFERLLKRDLILYFKSAGTPGATAVEYKLLREASTQSGVEFPKYYAWVKVFAGGRLATEGAVRLAAVNRTGFEVTSVLAAVQIKAAPNEVPKVFPGALVPLVLERARVKLA